MRRQVPIFLGLMIFALLSTAQNSPKREFRASWVATVKNLDWPSRPGLSTAAQKQEFLDIINEQQELGMNAVIVQVRPAGDAFYYSEIEPWSEWLTGQQGRGPDPWYDPLTFMIAETHKRGMEFHAWFNPFRARLDIEREKVMSVKHASVNRQDWMLAYGSNLYFDPGIPKARDYVTRVIMDVVRRYDIDAVHFDDYFYPYRIPNEAFPDTTSFSVYGRPYTSIDEWRRNNVDQFILQLRTQLKAEKPYVKLGISPFGVWRNRDKDSSGSNTRAGQTSYDDLYADVRGWLLKGWIDYVAPQAYFSLGYPLVPYEELEEWWSLNSYGQHVYLGKAVYKINNNRDTNWENPSQMPRQIRLDRESNNIQGSIYFRAKNFDTNPLGFSDSLKNDLYASTALVPVMPWLGQQKAPESPQNLEVYRHNDGAILTWEVDEEESEAAYFVLYRFAGKEAGSIREPQHIYAIINADQRFYLDKDAENKGKYTYVITAVSRLHHESSSSNPVYVKVKKR